MRKNESGKTEWVKHSRNTRYGKRGTNKRERAAIKKGVRNEGQGRGTVKQP